MKVRKEKRAKRKLFLGITVILLIILTACQNSSRQSSEQKQQQPQRLQIGMSFDSFVIERWLRDRDQFVMRAKELGADVNVQVANGDVQEQISQIEYFIKKKMDVIVIIAVDGEQLRPVIADAKKQGIRVISYDRLNRGSNTDLYVSFDNKKVGELMAQAMADAIKGPGNIFEICGSPADYNVAMVMEGFHETAQKNGLNTVYSSYCENWVAELAFDAVEEGLATTPRNLAGVMCGNDDLASQAFRALAENRLAGKVVLVGQDADLSACQRIVEGTQTMTVYKPVEILAAKAAEFAAALGYQKRFEEQKIEVEDIPDEIKKVQEEMKTFDWINEETGEVTPYEENPDKMQKLSEEEGMTPYYSISPVAVTKDNMEEVIIQSDFHTREEVYLNVKER